jgi:hypothetical protein
MNQIRSNPESISLGHIQLECTITISAERGLRVDAETAKKALKRWPTGPIAARENRGFLARAVSYLVHEAGVRQFPDIGTGLPSANNTHEVAQRLLPESRIVYVENDHCKPGCAHDRG